MPRDKVESGATRFLAPIREALDTLPAMRA
jgi:hypothetical protein